MFLETRFFSVECKVADPGSFGLKHEPRPLFISKRRSHSRRPCTVKKDSEWRRLVPEIYDDEDSTKAEQAGHPYGILSKRRNNLPFKEAAGIFALLIFHSSASSVFYKAV